VLTIAIREDGCPKGIRARVQARHLQVFEWDQRKIIRITGYEPPWVSRRPFL